MYTTEHFEIYAKGLEESARLMRQIAALATDEGGEYMRKCEGHIFGIWVRTCLEDCEINIDLSLWSHREPLFAIDKEEIARDKADNERAKAFVHKLLAHFKVTAQRDADSPSSLRLKIGNATVKIVGYPTELTYKCEKNCVAVLPGGKEVPLADAPLDL